MNSYINFINEGKKSKKRDKRSEIDPYGEEDWDDNGYYILVCLIYEDHFDFIISEGFIEHFDREGRPFVYYQFVKDGVLTLWNAKLPDYIIIDDEEDIDKLYKFGPEIAVSKNVTVLGWPHDNKVIFFNKNVVTNKDTFIKECEKFYDIGVKKFIPYFDKKIEDLNKEKDRLISREYIKNEIQ